MSTSIHMRLHLSLTMIHGQPTEDVKNLDLNKAMFIKEENILSICNEPFYWKIEKKYRPYKFMNSNTPLWFAV